jgi:hypothetical protein
MQTRWFLTLFLAPFLTLTPCTQASAQTAADTGRAIVEKSQQALFGYKTLTAAGAMTLSRGSETMGERTFSVELIEREPADAYDQARIVISAPTSLKDTQLLSWSSAKGDDQQWLVTPRTQRAQRIADRGRQAAFVSSTFSYEDILKWQVDDYDYVRSGQGPCPAGSCVIVDATPRNRFSSYSRLKAFYDDQYRLSKVEYFEDGRDRPRKTLVHSGYVRQGATWQPSRSVMTDHATETTTDIVWSHYQLNVAIDERVMSPSSASR